MLQTVLHSSSRPAGTVPKADQGPTKPYPRLTQKVNAQFSARMV